MSENAEPLCPECGVSDGFEPVGRFRSMCVVCGAVVKNEEIAPASSEEGER
jgi:transcription initiation factor TFIIIB Brf1 subunit/transcription initiation factor TFIIB